LRGDKEVRILYLDIDTTRADHLGCYGYDRNTSPNIDQIAKDGVLFTNYYCSDAPCLPSRTALMTGQFGIHTGVVNHGGIASQKRIVPNRDFIDNLEKEGLFGYIRQQGFHTVGITPFATRHSAWYFYCGFNEIYDTGKQGMESAHEVTPIALKWLEENAESDNWYLHINLWDPHTPYRTPENYPNHFESDPIPTWISEEILEKHKKLGGPHCAQEIMMYNDDVPENYPKHIGRLETLEDVKKLFDGYDNGIHYADDHVGKIINMLKQKGLYEDTAIIISTDHGENMGELGIYAEHATADQPTCHIPLIFKWPNGLKGHIDTAFHYNLDLLPTLADLLKGKKYKSWDGKSYASTLLSGEVCGQDELIISQMAHVCQRSVRFDDYLYIRTYHDGYHLFPKHMLFNLKDDPYEQHNLADEREDLVKEAASRLFDWHDEQMMRMEYTDDPLWTIIREGGPHHANGRLKEYCDYLKKTGRENLIPLYKEKHPNEFKK